MNRLRVASTYYDQSLPPDVMGEGTPPTLTTLAPASIVVATPTPLVVTGTGFKSNAKVWADEEQQLTTYVNSTTLHYTAQADQTGTQDITVHNGSLISNAKVLTVTATAGEFSAEQEESPEPEPEPEPEPDNQVADNEAPRRRRRHEGQ